MFERIAMSKYLLTIISALFLIQTAALCEVVPGADGRITYIGRTAVNDGSVSFDWTGTYLKVRFQGASLEMRVSDTGKNYYNVWLDSPMDAAQNGEDLFHFVHSLKSAGRSIGARDLAELAAFMERHREDTSLNRLMIPVLIKEYRTVSEGEELLLKELGQTK